MTQQPIDLNWTAFQYIAGELSADETAQFEDRLANDQVAREAVAEAVELAHLTAVAAVHPITLPTSPRNGLAAGIPWGRCLAWMGCGAAACFLVIVLAQPQLSQWRPHSPPSQVVEVDPEQSTSTTSARLASPSHSPELALVWAQSRSLQLATSDDPQVSDDRQESGDLHSVGVTLPRMVDEQNPDDEFIAAPSWMVTAVAGMDFGSEE